MILTHARFSARSHTTYVRDRALVNALLWTTAAVWAVGIALHMAMWAMYGSLF